MMLTCQSTYPMVEVKSVISIKRAREVVSGAIILSYYILISFSL